MIRFELTATVLFAAALVGGGCPSTGENIGGGPTYAACSDTVPCTGNETPVCHPFRSDADAGSVGNQCTKACSSDANCPTGADACVAVTSTGDFSESAPTTYCLLRCSGPSGCDTWETCTQITQGGATIGVCVPR